MQQENPIVPNDAKKRPGRPKKTVPAVLVDFLGIVDAPLQPDDIVNLVYFNPTMFKKIFQLYKSFDSSELEINFNNEGMKIAATDHNKQSYIYTNIDGRRMNFYYCRESICICVNRNNLERAIGALNKNHYKISFLLKGNYRSTLYMIIKDLEYDNEDSYEIGVACMPEKAPEQETNDDTEYPLRFRLSSRHFKTKINNIRKLSNILTIQKSDNSALQFTFATAPLVNWTCVYNNSEKIGLACVLAPGEIFNVSLNIESFKPFSNSMIGDDVLLAVDKRRRTSFTTFLDKKDDTYAAMVKVFTNIVNFNDDGNMQV